MIDKLIDILTKAFRKQDWLVPYGTTYRIAEDVLAELERDSEQLNYCLYCQNSEPTAIQGRVWCKRMGRYMKQDGFCSEGVSGND